ncbi:MAG: metal ABC transporter solute-binding protein, Zn/Mn family, partial [Mangrovicoccus sp.]
LGLEAQMEQVLADLARRSPVKAVADTLPVTELLAHDVYEGRYDPHVWMDPKLWSLVVSEMREAMAKTRPELAAEFTANAESYQTQLTRLDEYAQRVLGSVPEERRVLVTAHDAFGYFGRAYGYEVMGLQGISTEAEAGLNRISELVDTIVSRKIAAVFVESSVSDRAMRALIEGAAAQGHTLRIGGELFSDAMGPEGSYEGSYLGMLDHNITTIAKALGGVVPGRGMDGKLTKAV